MSPSESSFVARCLARVWWANPRECTSIARLPAGACRLAGRIRCSDPIASPIHGELCAAYIYKATFMSTRARGTKRRVLRKVTAFATKMELELDDGRVLLSPRHSTFLDPGGHHALVRRDFPGFRATEVLIRPGEQVRVMGRARLVNGGWLVSSAELYPDR